MRYPKKFDINSIDMLIQLHGLEGCLKELKDRVAIDFVSWLVKNDLMIGYKTADMLYERFRKNPKAKVVKEWVVLEKDDSLPATDWSIYLSHHDEDEDNYRTYLQHEAKNMARSMNYSGTYGYRYKAVKIDHMKRIFAFQKRREKRRLAAIAEQRRKERIKDLASYEKMIRQDEDRGFYVYERANGIRYMKKKTKQDLLREANERADRWKKLVEQGVTEADLERIKYYWTRVH